MRWWSSVSARRRLGAAALCAAVAALAGCGVEVGPGESQSVGLLVTRDFGRVPVGSGERSVDAPSSDTAMRLLERTHRVMTRYGGNFVQSIDGVAGGRRNGRPFDWFLYVNGILSDEGATSVEPRRGDRVWWDLHDWGTTADVRAVVGSFPEPFLHGEDGRRFPVRLECADDAEDACDATSAALEEAGVGLRGRARIGTTGGSDSLRVLVGTWPELRPDFVARTLEQGPRRSGVYARPASDGRSIALLDERGATVRRVGAGTGLVATTRSSDFKDAPIWLVTGVDDAGVQAAAEALTEDALRGKFAVAIRDDVPTALPVRR